MAENLPYSEKVMDHFLHPRNVGDMPDADGVGTVGNPVCVSPDTLIFVNPNVKEIKDLTEGTRVLAHDGKYHEITTVHKRPYNGKVHTISVTNLGSNVITPEHHILALKLGNRDKFKNYKKIKPDWYCAEELNKGDVVLYPLFKGVHDLEEIDFDIDKPGLDYKSKDLPNKVKINNDFCRLIGYYLAEGYVRTDKCKGTIGFVFNAKEKEHVEDVKNLMLRVFDLEPSGIAGNKKVTSADIYFYSARLARFFEKHFGKGAQGKHLPFWAMQLPSEKQKDLICGLWRGDGYIDVKRQRAKYVTISSQLIYQLRQLLLRQSIISNFIIGKAYGIHKKSYSLYIQDDESLGKICRITGKPIKIDTKRKNIHKSWLDGKFYYTTVRRITPSHYSGLIYNLEVRDAHSYVSNALTLHNCGDIMKMFIKVKDDIIVDVKFKTFGCGAAISTSSMVTEMVKGKTIDEALKISNKAVAEALGGLPPIKMHCSVLAEQALRSALADYYRKIGKDPSGFEPKPHTHGHDEHY